MKIENTVYPDGVVFRKNDVRYCPKCKSDFVGTPIPEQYRKLGYYGDNPPSHYSRLIGVEVPSYDGISFWQCPDCKHQWSRF